jgi:hypothetical protein
MYNIHLYLNDNFIIDVSIIINMRCNQLSKYNNEKHPLPQSEEEEG